MSGEQKAYIDSLVKQWTDGSISDSYLAEQIAHKMNEEWGLSLNSVGISGDDRCIYPSKMKYLIIMRLLLRLMVSIILLACILRVNMMNTDI